MTVRDPRRPSRDNYTGLVPMARCGWKGIPFESMIEMDWLIFDEVQHFTEGTLDSYQAADVIKIIMKCRVQVVCVGMPGMLNLVEGDKANDQLLRLRQKQVEVKPLGCSLEDFVAGDGSLRGEGMGDRKDIRFALAAQIPILMPRRRVEYSRPAQFRHLASQTGRFFIQGTSSDSTLVFLICSILAMTDRPASWRMPTPKQMEKMAAAVGREPRRIPLPGPDDPMPPEYWQSVLNDPRAGPRLDRPGPSIRTLQLSEIPEHVLRVACSRCGRIIEIQKADAVRLAGAQAVWKVVGQRLLDDTCQQRTGRHEEDGCWPSFE